MMSFVRVVKVMWLFDNGIDITLVIKLNNGKLAYIYEYIQLNGDTI